MKLNDRQKEAIYEHLNENVLVSAAAGSGKTRVLVDRIINLLTEKKVPISELAIMTFTNKATNEMKTRIKNAIEEAIKKNPSDEDLIKNSALLSNADILTISSFSKKIVDENYTVLSDFDPSYRMADEKELAVLYDDVLDALLEEKYGDPYYKSFFDAYFSKNDDSLKNIMLSGFNFLTSISFEKDYLKDRIDNFEEESKKYYELYKNDKENEILSMLSPLKDLDKVVDLCERIVDELNQAKKTTESKKKLEALLIYLNSEFSDKLKTINMDDLNFDTINRLLELLDKDNLPDVSYVSRGCGSYKEDYQNTVKPFLDLFSKKDDDNIIRVSLKFLKLLLTDDERFIYNQNEKKLLKLLLIFVERIEEAKKKKNIISISDPEKLALMVLYEKKGDTYVLSDVAKEISSKYKYIFVDEYQDTNDQQEKILAAISMNFENKNVFMVGDIKQSIYGFRNADPMIFASKYEKLASSEKDGKLITLSTNYRSEDNILKFINNIFSKMMFYEYGKIDYLKNDMLGIPTAEEKLDMASKDNHLDNIDTKVEVDVLYSANNDDTSSKIEKEAKYVAKRINELVASGANYRDITVLLRSVKKNAKAFIDEFSKAGIPAYAELKTGFYDRLEVKLVIDYLNIIDNPFQDIPLASVLMSNVYNVTDLELAFIKASFNQFVAFGKSDGKTTDSELYFAVKYVFENDIKENLGVDVDRLKIKLKLFMDDLETLRFKARYLPISELITFMYENVNIYRIISSMKDGKSRTANLDILYNNAKAFEQTSYVGLFNFLRFVQKIVEREDDSGLAKIYDENDNIVKIMTIHGSKGLEFPIVFMCNANKKHNMNDSRKSCLFDKEVGVGLDYINADENFAVDGCKKVYIKKIKEDSTIQEELRMLYVALTRAKKKLIITGFGTKDTVELADAYSKVEGQIEDNYSEITESKKQEYIDIVKDSTNYLSLIVSLFPYARDYCSINALEVETAISEVNSELVVDMLNLNGEEQVLDKKVLESNITNTYKYYYLQDIKPKLSVTEIKQNAKDALHKNKYKEIDYKKKLEEDLYYEDTELANEILENKNRVDGTALGNAYHRFMQFYDYNSNKYNCPFEKKNDNACDKIVDLSKIEKFKESIVGKMMADAYKNNLLYREHKFMKFYDENEVIVQGIIDAFIITKNDDGKDEIIVIDYKTDALSKDKIDKDLTRNNLVENYHVQLDEYAKVLEELTGLKVKEKYIYSFALDEAIKL